MANWAELLDQTPKAAPAALVQPGTVGPAGGGLVYQRLYEWVSYPAEPPLETYKDDWSDPEEPEKERVVRWWTPRSVGFRAKILVNPLGGELRIQARKFAAWIQGQIDESEYLTEIAPRVVAWEYEIVQEDGSRVAVDPPATGGWERFLDLPTDAYTWLTAEIRNAHLPKAPARGPSSGPPAGNTGSPVPTTSGPEPEPPES